MICSTTRHDSQSLCFQCDMTKQKNPRILHVYVRWWETLGSIVYELNAKYYGLVLSVGYHVLAWRVNSITNTGSAVHCNKESSIMGKSSILSTVKK
jgi:hypothetical protein